MAEDAEHEFTEAQVEESGRLMEEVPRIEAALKNFLSLKMAEGLAPPEPGAEAPASAASSPASNSSLQGCARVLLKGLNALELPPAPEWGKRHPQGKEELGLDFISRLGSYKVVQALWTKCLSAGQKPAKMLGKSSLRYALPEVSSQLLADLATSAASAKATEEELRTFLVGFEAALAGDVADPMSEAAVTWCSDLRATLAERQKARQALAEERVARQKSSETFSSELQAALSGQEAPLGMPPSTVQIEEVAATENVEE